MPSLEPGVEADFVALHYEDCVSHIKEYQKEHWVVASWLFAGQVALAYGLGLVYAGDIGLASVHKLLFLVPIAVGAFGLVLMNELSVALERNRRHLDTLRLLMGGAIVEIYIDYNSTKKVIESRQEKKRRLEMVTHFSHILVAAACSYALFAKYNFPIEAPKHALSFSFSW